MENSRKRKLHQEHSKAERKCRLAQGVRFEHIFQLVLGVLAPFFDYREILCSLIPLSKSVRQCLTTNRYKLLFKGCMNARAEKLASYITHRLIYPNLVSEQLHLDSSAVNNRASFLLGHQELHLFVSGQAMDSILPTVKTNTTSSLKKLVVFNPYIPLFEFQVESLSFPYLQSLTVTGKCRSPHLIIRNAPLLESLEACDVYDPIAPTLEAIADSPCSDTISRICLAQRVDSKYPVPPKWKVADFPLLKVLKLSYGIVLPFLKNRLDFLMLELSDASQLGENKAVSAIEMHIGVRKSALLRGDFEQLPLRAYAVTVSCNGASLIQNVSDEMTEGNLFVTALRELKEFFAEME